MKRIIFVVVIVFVVSVLVVFGVQYSIKKPPLEEISTARKNITLAKKSHCANYAPKTFDKACQNYDSAMYHWELENTKLVINRSYLKVKYFAEKANSLAEKAISITEKDKAEKKTMLEHDIKSLNSKLNHFDKHFAKYPLTTGERKNLSNAKMLLHESENAIKRGNYIGGQKKADVAIQTADKLTKQYTEVRREYFTSFSMWKKMTQNTVNSATKEKTNCVVVDKYARKCFLYKNGRLHQTFDIELGPNWIGRKNYRGDKATPEGNYRVVKKKSNGKSKYYRALLLDYPNSDDKRRFEENKAAGRLEPKSKIGDLIEIHGNGDKGIDWTDGCVALSDKDMDSLYNVCTEGTPVTIVGSTIPLTDIIKSIDE